MINRPQALSVTPLTLPAALLFASMVHFVSVFVGTTDAFAAFPKEPGVHVAEDRIHGTERERTFAVFVPYHVEDKAPLLVVFHGANNNGQNYIRDWAAEVGQDDMFVLAPNSSSETGHWAADDGKRVLGLIEKAAASYGIGRRRIFLAGFSSGGWMVYEMALKNPRSFRAAVVIAGWATDEALEAARHSPYKVPFYVFAGKYDQGIKIERVRSEIDLLKKYGFEVRFEELEMGHASPIELIVLALDWFDGFE